MSVLVVDDEQAITDLIDVILTNEGFEVLKFYDAAEALEAVEMTSSIELAILDVMMPMIDGFKLCMEIRKKHTFPIIMLTARSEAVDKIMGLSLGADDYVTKPFLAPELVARVKAQLRRYKTYANAKADEDIMEINGLTVNRRSHTVRLFDEDISLTPTEFDILWMLCENVGEVVSSENIFESVWKEKYYDSNNTVMVHIRRLREKLKEQPRNPKIIKTVWGVGYKIEK